MTAISFYENYGLIRKIVLGNKHFRIKHIKIVLKRPVINFTSKCRQHVTFLETLSRPLSYTKIDLFFPVAFLSLFLFSGHMLSLMNFKHRHENSYPVGFYSKCNCNRLLWSCYTFPRKSCFKT